MSMRNTVGDQLGKRISWSTKGAPRTTSSSSDDRLIRKLVDNAITNTNDLAMTTSASVLNDSSHAHSPLEPTILSVQQAQQTSLSPSLPVPVNVPLFSDESKTAKRLHDHHVSTSSSNHPGDPISVHSRKKSTANTSADTSSSRSHSAGETKTSSRKKKNKDDSSGSNVSGTAAAANSEAGASNDETFLASLQRSLANAETHSDSINLMYGNTTTLLNSSTIKTATSASSQGPIPKQLKGTYTNDYNLLEANATILRKFELTRQQELPGLQQRLLDIERCLGQRSLRIVERKALEKECEQLTDAIENCSTHKEAVYANEVASILERYQQLGPRVRIIRFGKSTKDITPAGQDKERIVLIEQFMEVARKYIDVQITRVLPNDRSCTNCNLSGNELAVDDEGVSCCPRCGLERLFAYNCPVPIEELPSSRSEYEDRKNLYKALMRYQGKQPNKLPLSLENDLDEYFRSFGLPVGSEIRSVPLNPKGSRGNTSLQLMFRALSETGHAEHYENCNLICAQYWGWMLPDVSHLEDIIMADYDATQAVYERMVRKRKSSINTQFRLFKHLQARGHACSLSDFKVVTTPDILAALEEMWREMVEGAKVDGLVYIPTL